MDNQINAVNQTPAPQQLDTSQQPDLSRSLFPTYYHYHEELRKQPITPQHIRQTKRLLRDFSIDLPMDFKQIVSQFTYYHELENWRRYYILRQLRKMEQEGESTDE